MVGDPPVLAASVRGSGSPAIAQADFPQSAGEPMRRKAAKVRQLATEVTTRISGSGYWISRCSTNKWLKPVRYHRAIGWAEEIARKKGTKITKEYEAENWPDMPYDARPGSFQVPYCSPSGFKLILRFFDVPKTTILYPLVCERCVPRESENDHQMA